MSSSDTLLMEALPGQDIENMEMEEIEPGSETSDETPPLLSDDDQSQLSAKRRSTTSDQSRSTTPTHQRSNSYVGSRPLTLSTSSIEADDDEKFIGQTRKTCDLILRSKDNQEKVATIVHDYISMVDNFEDNIQKYVGDITPLHCTVKSNCYLATEILLEQKHSTCVENQSKETPLDVALRLKHDDIAALIIRHMKKEETTHQIVIYKFKTNGELRDYLKGGFEKTVMAVLDHMVSVNKDGGHLVRYDIMDADDIGRTPDDTNFNVNDKTPYQIIAKSGNENIINHPVVMALTKYKWKKFGRLLFWLLAAKYMFILFTLTFSAVTSVKSQPITPLNNSNVSKQEQMTPVGAEPVNTYNHPLDIARGVFEVLTCVLICMRLFIHILEIYREKLDYLKDTFNVIELVSILLLLAVIPVRLTHPAASWYIFAIGYFFWVLLIFKYSVVFRQTGAYAQILFGILVKDLTQFGLLFVIITLAFSGTFLLALKADGNLETHTETSSFWGILFVGVRTLTDGSVVDYTEYNTFSCIIMLVFLIVALVILLNLLIAQMTDTYNKVQSVADRYLEKNIALICARMECFGMPCFDKKAKRKEAYIDGEIIHDFALLVASPEEEIKNDIQYVKRRHLMSETHVQTIKTNVKEELKVLSTIRKTNKKNTNCIIENIDSFDTKVEHCSYNLSNLQSQISYLIYMTSEIKDMIKQLIKGKMSPADQDTGEIDSQSDNDRSTNGSRQRLPNDFEKPPGCAPMGQQFRQVKEVRIRSSSEQAQFSSQIQKRNLGEAIKDREEHEVLSLLSTYLEDNKNVNLLVDSSGSTPLHYAAEVGYFYVVKKLLQHNANPMKETKDNKIPLQFALTNGHDDVAALIANSMDNESIRAFFRKHASLLNAYIKQDTKFEKSLTAILESMLEREHTGGATVHYGLLEADTDGNTPSDFNKFNPTDISPFNILTATGNQTLINHPVVRLLIRSKWEAFARTRFVYMAIFYLVSLFAFTFSIVTSVFAVDVTSYSSCLDNARACFEVLTLLFAGGRLFVELVEWYKNGIKYFHDTFNYLELTSSILVLCVLPVRYSQPRAHWYLLAIAYLLWTLMIFKYAACFKQTGAYAQILWQIMIGDVVQFGLLFAVVNLAFAGTFLLALKAEDGLQIHEETSTFWGVLYVGVRTLVESGPVVTYTGDGGYGVFSTIIKIVFLFVTVVILLNILIAQLNDTYQKIQTKASLHLEANIARIITRMENNDWNFLCGFFCRQPSRIMYYKEKERIGNLPETLEMSSGISDMSDDLQHIADTQITTQLSVNTVIRKVGQVKQEIPKVVESNEKLYDNVKDDVKRVEEKVTEMGDCFNVGVNEDIGTMISALDTLMEEVREYMSSSGQNKP